MKTPRERMLSRIKTAIVIKKRDTSESFKEGN